MLRKLVVEAIGTFFLVLTVGQTVINPANQPSGALAPLAIGSALMVMVYAGGHISGAHYNPAVTLAVWLRGKCTTPEMPAYMAAQLVGAALAAGAVLFFKHGTAVDATTPVIGPALLAEFLFTFALTYTLHGQEWHIVERLKPMHQKCFHLAPVFGR
jgi:aquaporin Z